jgi:hemerythrin
MVKGLIEMEFKWLPSMSVSEETIDGQHRKLLAKVTELTQILSSMDVDVSQLRETVHFLYVYINEHFAYEEKYMSGVGFPGLENHRKMHQRFVQFYDNLQKEFREKSVSGHFSSLDVKELVKKIETFLGKWLVNHIETVDQEYAKYIRSKRA